MILISKKMSFESLCSVEPLTALGRELGWGGGRRGRTGGVVNSK